MKNSLSLILLTVSAGFMLTGCSLTDQFLPKKTTETPPAAPSISVAVNNEQTGENEMVEETTESTAPITATFVCKDKKSIIAKFSEKGVDLTLPAGKTLSLPTAMSASGARYANADETIVFWNKGNTAFLEENGKETFSDCLQIEE